MRYLPIVLLVGILFNSICVVLFRIKLDRRMDSQFSAFSQDLKKQIVDMSAAALASIDAYFISNSVRSVSSPGSPSFVSPRPSSFFQDSGEWDFEYYLSDGVSLARVGVVYFRVGDKFPRGGRITSIYPDCVVVDNEYFFRNRSFLSSRVGSNLSLDIPDTSYKSNEELNRYVGKFDTMRK